MSEPSPASPSSDSHPSNPHEVLLRIDGVVAASRMVNDTNDLPAWGLESVAGRLVEIAGGNANAMLTVATKLILETQRRSEPVVWIGPRSSVFFPPDLADSGVDLSVLPVVRLRDTLSIARAADTLVRSGGFGLVIVDLAQSCSEFGEALPLPTQSRLGGLAQRHHTAVVCLTPHSPVVTESESSSGGARRRTRRRRAGSGMAGSLVSLRSRCEKQRTAFDRFRCELRVLKDKRRGPGWQDVEICRGPDGLC